MRLIISKRLHEKVRTRIILLASLVLLLSALSLNIAPMDLESRFGLI